MHVRVALVSAAVALGAGPVTAQTPSPDPSGPSARGYATIQEAVRANPGRWIYVPPGDYEISDTIRIDTDRSGLFGPGRIIQTNPERAIVRVERAAGVQLRDLTLTRPAGKTETMLEAVQAIDCRDLVLENLQVLDNQTRTAAVELRGCAAGQIRNCLVRNYQRVSVDDRTGNPELGYAFNCVIGTGILVREGRGTLIQGNRVIEERTVPTEELKRRYALGAYVKKNATRGRLANAKDWEAGYTNNWQQGTAIHVASPTTTDFAQVLGNYVENAGQGFDVHADHVILAQNVVNDALIGMKAMHGSRNVVIVGNQFSKNTLWGIGLMPGAASAAGANVDGGSIIANNIISDFGYGRTRWIWGDAENVYPLRFDHGQKPENPPLADVVVQGNVVYDTGRDGVAADGGPKPVPPRYKYAVLIEQGPGAPRGLHFANNVFHPGTDGVSNVELKP
jgi:hypothetical protein